jgi:hypothetical protein
MGVFLLKIMAPSKSLGRCISIAERGLFQYAFLPKHHGEKKGKIPLTKERTKNKHYKLLIMREL